MPPPQRSKPRRRVPLLRKQYISVVDSRTTMVCLDAAGQIRDVDEPFDTLAGQYAAPPTHIHCRSVVLPWLAGVIEEQRTDANAEILRRPRREKRKGPEGYEGPIPPPAPADVAPQVMRSRPALREPRNAIRVTVRSSLAEWDPLAAVLNRAEGERGDNDAVLERLLSEQGFDGRPRVVSDEQATRLLHSDPASLEVWRGLAGDNQASASVYAEQFRSGPLHVAAGGIYGHGTYWSTGQATAAEYADGPDGVVMRAVLLGAARVIGWEELEQLHKDTTDRAGPRLVRSLRTVLADPGRFAAAMGFDAVLLPTGQVLVLNRTALVVVR